MVKLWNPCIEIPNYAPGKAYMIIEKGLLTRVVWMLKAKFHKRGKQEYV